MVVYKYDSGKDSYNTNHSSRWKWVVGYNATCTQKQIIHGTQYAGSCSAHDGEKKYPNGPTTIITQSCSPLHTASQTTYHSIHKCKRTHHFQKQRNPYKFYTLTYRYSLNDHRKLKGMLPRWHSSGVQLHHWHTTKTHWLKLLLIHAHNLCGLQQNTITATLQWNNLCDWMAVNFIANTTALFTINIWHHRQLQ